MMFKCTRQITFYLFFTLILYTVHSVTCLYSNFKNINVNNYSVNDPLFLTPIIESGDVEKARNLSRVISLAGSVESYSGFFTVNKTYDTNMFFWFFPSQLQVEKCPVIIWLQGGPGASSLFGLLAEHGPYQVKKDLKVILRKYSWNKMMSVLYVDNPAGTGFSFTNSDDGYAKNEEDVAVNLYKTLLQFFTMFPDLQKNDFYVSGESYAGKYVPALAYKIHQENKFNDRKINLRGLAIGNGACDPVHMLNYGEYLYEIGLIDENTKNIFNEKRSLIINLIKDKKYREAFEVLDVLILNELSSSSSTFKNATGFSNFYNYLVEYSSTFDLISAFFQQHEIRNIIHVGNLTFHTSEKVVTFLKSDIMRSISPIIEILIENYKLLIYNGQLDIIIAYPLTEEFVKNLKWSGAEEYKTAPRKIWKIKNKIAGYSKTVKNFTEVLVRNAGHMVPTDQPLFAFDLINRFVYDKSF